MLASTDISRRDFGKGLAAILASGVAPQVASAVPFGLQRGLGLRLGAMRGGKKLTARDYVLREEAIVWSATNNKGFDIYDRSSTTIRNLVNGVDYNINGSFSWQEKNLLTSGSVNFTGSGLVNLMRGATGTFEFCTLDALITNGYNGFYAYPAKFRIFYNPNSSSSIHYRTMIGNGGSSYSTGNDISSSFETSSVVWDGITVRFYVNGELMRSGTYTNTLNPDSLNTYANTNMCALRLYPTPLSQAEILKNHAVDKALYLT